MMIRHLFASLSLLLSTALHGGVDIDNEAFGESLGGWEKSKTVADYKLSGAQYRSYQPEITPTPDGGIFVSLRIDHLRGWLASDDHAVLEVSFAPDGSVVSAQSSLAIQGRTISSDLIRGTANAGAHLTGVEGAVKIGTNLVADLSAKLLREKIVEAGRVNFPAVLRHNYNLLFQAVRTPQTLVAPVGEVVAEEAEDPKAGPKAPAKASEATRPKATPLEIHPYGKGSKKP